MKKVLSFVAAASILLSAASLIACSNDEVEIGLKKSDLYGTWNQHDLVMKINKNGTYVITGYAGGESCGTWSFDGISRIWVQHRDDGYSYTNTIHLLNRTTFSYTDQYGNHDIWARASNDFIEEPDEKPEEKPEEEPASQPFRGLKEILNDGSSWDLFKYAECDEKGRLICYETDHVKIKYEYSENTITKYELQSWGGDGYELVQKTIYSLTNGIVTSYMESYYEDGVEEMGNEITIKYDSNKRIIQRTENYYSTSGKPKYRDYYYKWNSSGDLYESTTYYYYGGDDNPSYITTYQYNSSTSHIPPLYLRFTTLAWVFATDIDPFLVWSGYFGNSMPKHTLKSEHKKMYPDRIYDQCNWSYSFDTKGRPTKIMEEYEYLYNDSNALQDQTNTFTLTWE